MLDRDKLSGAMSDAWEQVLRPSRDIKLASYLKNIDRKIPSVKNGVKTQTSSDENQGFDHVNIAV